jgi:hypothetical protein
LHWRYAPVRQVGGNPGYKLFVNGIFIDGRDRNGIGLKSLVRLVLPAQGVHGPLEANIRKAYLAPPVCFLLRSHRNNR